MRIKSDKWIREMAKKGMITPFKKLNSAILRKENDILWYIQLWL